MFHKESAIKTSSLEAGGLLHISDIYRTAVFTFVSTTPDGTL